jgi:hypothetical protein
MLTTATAAAIYQNYIDTRDYKLMYLNNFANVMFVTTTITLPAAAGGVCRTAHAAAVAAAPNVRMSCQKVAITPAAIHTMK